MTMSFQKSCRFTMLSQERNDNFLRMLETQNSSILEDKLCIVSIIGKSSFGQACCKTGLLDEALQRDAFRGQIGQNRCPQADLLTEIEGFYDYKNKVLFLHHVSPLDTDALLQSLQMLNKQTQHEQVFFQMWTDLNFNSCKALLVLFLVSHIVVLTHPNIQIDLSWLQSFRLLEQLRKFVQPNIEQLLQTIPGLPSDWVKLGRPCSPRLLFIFNEVYPHFSNGTNNLKSDDLKKYQRTNHVLRNKRKYELYLEDQLYRILRKNRTITNICTNSLFAVCNQADFVYIADQSTRIDNIDDFYEQLLNSFCSKVNEEEDPFQQNQLGASGYNETSDHESNFLSADAILDENQSNQRFFDFLWTHISTAINKGFDDNVGRHNIGPFFEKPSLALFFKVFDTLKTHMFRTTAKQPATGIKQLDSRLKKLIEIDREFSEACCAKVYGAALAFYKENLPANYTEQIHEQKLSQSLQLFASLARGLAAAQYAQTLRNDCEAYWRNGHQVCSEQSFFGNSCILGVHDVPTSELSGNSTLRNVRLLEHCSGVKFVSACNCGFRQANRDDPFTIIQANFIFYRQLAVKCRCKDMQKIEFPTFFGPLESAKPINVLLKLMMAENVNLEDEADFEEDEEEKETEDETNIKLKPQLKRSEFLSQEFKSQEFKMDSTETSPSGESNSDSDDMSYHSSEEEEEEDEECQEEEDEESSDGLEDELGTNSKQRRTLRRLSYSNRMNLVAQRSPSTSKSKSEKVSDFFSVSNRSNSYSQTEYLDGMINSLSPSNLLPRFNSWSLVRLGASSIYTHNLGIQDQPGFLSGSHYLLPWDVNVKLENCDELPPYWQGKYPPGIKNKRILTDGIRFTVKIFFGMEYECSRGHRFISSRPGHRQKASTRHIKENANIVACSDMPLYLPCVCNHPQKEQLAQLMRIHVVTPKAPVLVTLKPRVTPSSPSPIFFPIDECIKLTPASYWVLRLPFVYQCDTTSTQASIYPRSKNRGCLLSDCFGISEHFDDSDHEYIQSSVY